MKYDLLRVLAERKTETSYALLKKLLLNQPPTKGDASGISYAVLDSMALAKTLFPELLKLSADTLFVEELVSITDHLIDSNLISIKDLAPYHDELLAVAIKHFKEIGQDEEKWWNYYDWVPLIGKFNDAQTNALLGELLKTKEPAIRYAAMVALLKNNRPVNSADIERLASEDSYRKNLYEEMKKEGKLKLFPTRYATQLKIAQSEVFAMASDDDDPSSISFVGERTVDFMGKKKSFLLFKVSFGEGEDVSSYLGVAGPYEKGSKEIITTSEAGGVYWDEEYDRSKIDGQFKAFLEQMEKWMREKEQATNN